LQLICTIHSKSFIINHFIQCIKHLVQLWALCTRLNTLITCKLIYEGRLNSFATTVIFLTLLALTKLDIHKDKLIELEGKWQGWTFTLMYHRTATTWPSTSLAGHLHQVVMVLGFKPDGVPQAVFMGTWLTGHCKEEHWSHHLQMLLVYWSLNSFTYIQQ